MARSSGTERVELRMSRQHSGLYDLEVGRYHFEMYVTPRDETGAYGKTKTVQEWFGSINGHVVITGETTYEIKKFLKPLVDQAVEVERLDRRREQGTRLLSEIFEVTDESELPDNVKTALAQFGAESVAEIEKVMHQHMGDEEPTDDDPEDD